MKEWVLLKRTMYPVSQLSKFSRNIMLPHTKYETLSCCVENAKTDMYTYKFKTFLCISHITPHSLFIFMFVYFFFFYYYLVWETKLKLCIYFILTLHLVFSILLQMPRSYLFQSRNIYVFLSHYEQNIRLFYVFYTYIFSSNWGNTREIQIFSLKVIYLNHLISFFKYFKQNSHVSSSPNFPIGQNFTEILFPNLVHGLFFEQF